MKAYLEQFEKHPFRPLVAHMARVKECVATVDPMFHAVQQQQYDELARLAELVFKTEHAADIIKNEIRQVIPVTFSLPVYRGDLLNYLKLQDDMADAVEDIAVLLTIKKLAIPDVLTDSILGHVQRVLTVCDELFKCTDHLADLVESDFHGLKGRSLLEQAAKAEHAEWEADKSQYALAKHLFALDDQMKATDIFLWSSVFQQLGILANYADKSAERLRLMLSR